jgi:DNA polymerase epsilon subunit 1
MSFLCTLLNREMHLEFTNHQYQDLQDKDTLEYATRSECTIFFEVDGPYRAMVIPKSTEEEKQLKKRYVVFQDNGSIAELKGFEIKRRGELKLIKNFQKQVFAEYLAGDSLDGCYKAVAVIADHFLDIIQSRGEDMDDEELLELISESRSMSRKLSDYKQAKSMTVTTATRLGQLLGAETIKDAGVNCSWIVSKVRKKIIPSATTEPLHSPTTPNPQPPTPDPQPATPNPQPPTQPQPLSPSINILR